MICYEAVSWLGLKFARLPPHRLGFDPRSLRPRLMFGKLVLKPVCLQVLHFYPISIIPPVLRIYIFYIYHRWHITLSIESLLTLGIIQLYIYIYIYTHTHTHTNIALRHTLPVNYSLSYSHSTYYFLNLLTSWSNTR